MKKKVLFVDVGIVDLVSVLNQIKGTETISSCDGHGVQHAWVSIECSPKTASALLDLVLLKRNANIRGIGNGKSWLSINALSGKAFHEGKSSSGKRWRKALEFSEAVSIAIERIKHAQNKISMSISFPNEYNGKSTLLLKERFLDDLAQSELLEEECPFDVRPVPQGAYSFFDGDPERKPVFVRGVLEVKRDEDFVCGFLRDGSKQTFVRPCYFDYYPLKAGDIIEGDGWTFYDDVRTLGTCADCILQDAEESGKDFDDYFVLAGIRTINGKSGRS